MGEHKAKILIADDYALNRLMLSTNLQDKGYAVEGAENGKVALELLHSKPFDLVLLDLVMPVMDGFEVLSALKEDKDMWHIPVLVISATEDMETIIRCIEMGAVDYLTRPIDPVLLHARINASLASKRIYDLERNYTQELQIQNAELDAFASTVAHDLRTPLTPIWHAAELLQTMFKERLGEQGMFLVEKIIANSNRMSNIIEALLLLSRLRHEHPTATPIDMGQAVNEVLERVAHMKEERNGTVVLPDTWPTALGYAPWIVEVWTNYISNALKYGGEPPHVELGSTQESVGMVRFWIKDNGPGLTKEQQTQLFTPFTRLATERAEGHGLGLSIVERIINNQKGRVGVESTLGAGSTFWFTLPTMLSKEQVESLATPEPSSV